MILFVVIIIHLFYINILPTIASDQGTGYIVAESDGGLSNRLRVLISHMYLAEILHNKAHLLFIWDVNEACPGHFLESFKPIPSVTFATSSLQIDQHQTINPILNNSTVAINTANSNSTQHILLRNALKVYPKSRDGFEQTMLNYDVNVIVKKFKWWKIQLRLWEHIVSTREIERKVEDYVALHHICNITRQVNIIIIKTIIYCFLNLFL
jgi:hypothetical protein